MIEPDGIDELAEAPTDELAALMIRAERARLRRDYAERDRIVEQLGERMGIVMQAASLLGQQGLMREADELAGERLTYARQRLGSRILGWLRLTRVRFLEAVGDLLGREPRLAPGWEATRDEYTQGGFAAARAASEQIAMRVQEAVARAADQGTSQERAENAILQALESATTAELESTQIDPAGFTRAYAETVFRTTTQTAYQRGRVEQARSPAVRKAVSGFRFSTASDPDVRKNHRAAEGYTAHMDDPAWDFLRPPLGYRCRCTLELVPTVELVAMGLADKSGAITARAQPPAGSGPDLGFVPGGGPVRPS